MLSVSANLIRLLMPFCAKDRKTISGVWIEPRFGGGCYVVATNGYSAVIAFDEKASADQAAMLTVAKADLAKLARAERLKFGAKIEIDIITPDRSWQVASLEGKDLPPVIVQVSTEQFPYWRGIIPKGPINPTNENYIFQPSLVAQFGALSSSVQIITGETYNSPAYVNLSRTDMFGLIMPMRTRSLFSLPKWLGGV